MGDENRSDDGPNAWVVTAPFVPEPKDVLPIDDLLRERWHLWRAMETVCVAGCCGLDAFDFGVDTVRLAVPIDERAAFAGELATIELLITGSGATHVTSKLLNAHLHAWEFVEVLRELRRSLSLND